MYGKVIVIDPTLILEQDTTTTFGELKPYLVSTGTTPDAGIYLSVLEREPEHQRENTSSVKTIKLSHRRKTRSTPETPVVVHFLRGPWTKTYTEPGMPNGYETLSCIFFLETFGYFSEKKSGKLNNPTPGEVIAGSIISTLTPPPTLTHHCYVPFTEWILHLAS